LSETKWLFQDAPKVELGMKKRVLIAFINGLTLTALYVYAYVSKLELLLHEVM